MGGVPKGLLAAPNSEETLVERLLRVSHEALGAHQSLLVGRAPAYAGLGLSFVEDAPAGVGPLGGLCALLDAALERGNGAVIALACDMPHVSAELIRRLMTHAPAAAAVAPRTDGKWQPLVARYEPRRALRPPAPRWRRASERSTACWTGSGATRSSFRSPLEKPRCCETGTNRATSTRPSVNARLSRAKCVHRSSRPNARRRGRARASRSEPAP